MADSFIPGKYKGNINALSGALNKSASEQEFVRSGILRGFLDFLKNDVFGVRDGHTLRFQQ